MDGEGGYLALVGQNRRYVEKESEIEREGDAGRRISRVCSTCTMST